MFKNVGLNDAADPFINACLLGVRAGMVLVVLVDIDVEQSLIQQDSRPYAELPCSLCLEPRSVPDAYVLARQAPELSERLGTLVVLRLTNLMTRAVGPIMRREALTARLKWCRAPERWVAHPVNGEAQRRRLEDRQEAVACWVDGAYPKPSFASGVIVRVTAGMAACAVKEPPALGVYILPPPRPWIEALATSAARVVFEEHGGPYLASKVAAGVGAARVTARLIRPEVERHYRITERYEPLYALLRATGDAAFLHSGKAALEEALARRAAVTVIVLDNGRSQGTGGQRLPGTCRLNASALEYHDLDFPVASDAGPQLALSQRPNGPRLIRLKTPF
jgi:TPP-dependent indolepyruvate ferredoxin oxidoreductase alpha subunit